LSGDVLIDVLSQTKMWPV